MEEKTSKDLRETREQITSCFENISCFMLPHPGLSVTRKTYGGEITGGKGLEPEFRQLLDRYMRRVSEWWRKTVGFGWVGWRGGGCDLWMF
jgi:atlastin